MSRQAIEIIGGIITAGLLGLYLYDKHEEEKINQNIKKIEKVNKQAEELQAKMVVDAL